MIARFWTALKPMIAAHFTTIVGIWIYLVAGAVLASWVLWDAHQRGSHQTKVWAWATQFFPPTILLYLFIRFEEKPLWTAFGVARYVGPRDELLPPNTRPPLVAPEARPPHLWLILVLTAILPGLGQAALKRWVRAVTLWLLIAFSASFVVLYLAGVTGSWKIAEPLLPKSSQAQTVTVEFRVPEYLFWIMLGELSAMFLWAYADCVSLADERIHDLPHRKAPPRAFLRLRVTSPNASERVTRVQVEDLYVGSAPDSHVLVEGDGILPRHVSIYLHHPHEHPHHLFDDPHHDEFHMRTFAESATALLNGKPTHQTDLKPGDVMEVGNTRVEFLPLEDAA